MRRVRRAGVRDLKNNLSRHLRRIREGNRVIVTDRGLPIAELRPYRNDLNMPPLVREWIETGVLHRGRGEKRPLPPSPLHLRSGTARRLLDEDRRERK